MREIKFRGRRYHIGYSWVFGNLIERRDILDRNTKYYYIEDYSCENRYEVSGGSVGQYTGLKDKNGKEIYEGDILSFVYRPTRETKENYRGVIEFGNPNGAYNWGWQIRFIGTQPLTAKDILFWIEDIYTDCEVIGNIHENAELLKGE